MKIIIFSFLGLLYSCDYTKNNKPNDIKVALEKSHKEVKVETHYSQDTVEITAESTIIAFSLTQDEYDILSESNVESYDEGYSDMMYYLDQCSPKLKANKVIIKSTASHYIKIGNQVICRKNINSNYGLIFINKKRKYEILSEGLLESEIFDKAKSMNMILN